MSGYDEAALRRIHALSNSLGEALNAAQGGALQEKLHALAWCSVWLMINAGGPELLPEMRAIFSGMMDDVERCLGPEEIAIARATSEDFNARIDRVVS